MLTKSQRRFGILTICLALVIILSSTLAWRDISQHKTNHFTTTTVVHNVVLVENFEPVENWRVNETKIKEVTVRNGQDTDDVDKYIYDDAYVRIQFKEFMDIKTQAYIYSDDRLMVDRNGNFLRFNTLNEAQTYMDEHDIPNHDRIVELEGYYDSQPYYYIKTQSGDINGQYGRFLVMEITDSEAQSLVSGQTNHNDASKTQHQITPNDEDSYTTHTWSASNPDYAYSDLNSPFNAYVRWTLGEDVILIDEWDGTSVAKWIIDTDSPEGWVYWGEPLVHGNNLTTTPESITSELLKAVTLISQPAGIGQYYIHVNMDAVSFNELSLWQDAPLEIITSFNGDKTEIHRRELLIEITENIQGLVDDNNVKLEDNEKNDLELAKEIVLKPQASIEEINNAYKNMLSLYNVLIDEMES